MSPEPRLTLNKCNVTDNQKSANIPWYHVAKQSSGGEYLKLVKLQRKPGSFKYYLQSVFGSAVSSIYLIHDCKLADYNNAVRAGNTENIHNQAEKIFKNDKLYILKIGFEYSEDERKFITSLDIGNDFVSSVKINDEKLAKEIIPKLSDPKSAFVLTHLKSELIKSDLDIIPSILSILDKDQRIELLCAQVKLLGKKCMLDVDNQQANESLENNETKEQARQQRAIQLSENGKTDS